MAIAFSMAGLMMLVISVVCFVMLLIYALYK